jgi:hypothetical protein
MLGEGACPDVGSTSLAVKKAVESIAAPKGRGPPGSAAFPLQTGIFKGPPEGAMIAVVDPQASRRREWWARAMPPLWQYLSAPEADEAIAVPKGRGPLTPRAFFPANFVLSWGPRREP